MNKLTITYLLLIFTSLLACKKSKDNPEPEINSEINSWIHAEMKKYYLWENEMKPVAQTELLLEPDAYFETLLFEEGETDRFSLIQESSKELQNSLNGISTTYGIKYSPFWADAAKSRLIYSIAYTLKESVAERMGLKRGDLISKVNGQDITLENYKSLLSAETIVITKGKYEEGTLLDTEETISLTKEVTQANALQYYSIIPIEDRKVGYFVYTQFLTSSEDSLNTLFAEFKANQIDELIVDLRYNPGGYISTQELLSSLIVPNPSEDKLMSYQVWNDEQTAYYQNLFGKDVFNSYFFTSKTGIGQLNNPGTLKRVYFLVSNGSASASEGLIATLKPFMDVILIGEHTYGKNVGSYFIDDDDNRWDWGMLPIVLKTYDSNGQSEWGTEEGFAVDYEVKDNVLPFKDFGDTEETLLKVALENIFGAEVLASARKGAKVTPVTKVDLLLNEAVSDNPILNRKEMWVTEFPSK